MSHFEISEIVNGSSPFISDRIGYGLGENIRADQEERKEEQCALDGCWKLIVVLKEKVTDGSEDLFHS
jgi:hypothetical protein